MPNVWNSSIANLDNFTSVGIPWETIFFEVCPGTGYPKEPPWDKPTPIDCILVVNHGRGCIVVVNSDRTLSPLLPFLGTLGPIVCSGPPGTLGDYLDSGQDPKCHFWYGATQIITHTDKQASKSILENIEADKNCDYNVNSSSPSNERGHA